MAAIAVGADAVERVTEDFFRLFDLLFHEIAGAIERSFFRHQSPPIQARIIYRDGGRAPFRTPVIRSLSDCALRGCRE